MSNKSIDIAKKNVYSHSTEIIAQLYRELCMKRVMKKQTLDFIWQTMLRDIQSHTHTKIRYNNNNNNGGDRAQKMLSVCFALGMV